jgi:DNA polymerase-3 subunit gamma/tau
MEALGDALMQMREALDPRVSLEVALVRIARPEVDTSPASLVERLERLERGAPAAAAAPAVQAPAVEAPAAPSPPPRDPKGKPALGALQTKAAPKIAPAPPKESPAPKAAGPTGGGAMPTRDEITTAWADAILPKLARRITVWFGGGRFASVEGNVATYALPDANFKLRAEKYHVEVQKALADHYGTPVKLELTVDDAPVAPVAAADPEPDDEPDFDAPVDAAPAASPEEHVKMAFPGAEEVDE